MPIQDRVMTRPRAHSSTALRVAVSGRQPAARGLDRRPAYRCATRDHLAAGHGNVAYANSVNRP